MTNRKLFVGSSKEAYENGALDLLVRKLVAALPPTVAVVSWMDTDWKNLESALKTLTESLSDYSYAVFLAYPDDKLEFRGKPFYSCRDNVLIEFGLFLTHLGTERTFLILPSDTESIPPDDIPYKIPSDIKGAIASGLYTVSKDSGRVHGRRLTFNLAHLVEKINAHDTTWSRLTPSSARNELSRIIGSIDADLRIVGRTSSYYTGYLSRCVDTILQLRAGVSEQDAQDAALDFLLYVDEIRDVLSPDQLARKQHHKNGIMAVSVFAEKPLEFEELPELEGLRNVIIENLLAGVKYNYIITDKSWESIGSKLKLLFEKLTQAETKKAQKNMTFYKVDRRLFKTYFTLHFTKRGAAPKEVYMSLLRSRREKDLLIEVTDINHRDRISNIVAIVTGKDEKYEDVMTKSFI